MYSQQALILDQVQALFRILVPDPAAQAWDSATSRSNATLRTFSMAFLEALIGDYREGVERAGQVGVSRRPITDAQARFMLEPRFDIARRWLQAGSWPDGATPEGVIGHFVAWGGLANAARERGQRLYCWFGPGVPLKTIRFQRVPGEPERLVQIK